MASRASHQQSLTVQGADAYLPFRWHWVGSRHTLQPSGTLGEVGARPHSHCCCCCCCCCTCCSNRIGKQRNQNLARLDFCEDSTKRCFDECIGCEIRSVREKLLSKEISGNGPSDEGHVNKQWSINVEHGQNANMNSWFAAKPERHKLLAKTPFSPEAAMLRCLQPT